MRFAFILFVLIIVTSACSKYKNEIEECNVSGDYEWYYSTDGPVNSVSFDQVEHQYGIRFRKSGKVNFYKDGKLLDRYKIVGVVEGHYYSEGDLELTYKIDKFNFGKLILDGTELVHSDWPFESMSNKFLKVSE